MSAELDPFNAFVDLAALPDETHPPGPRLAVKDMIAVAGLKQTCGLPVRANDRALHDAAIVAAFHRAGYRVVGTTTSDNAGFGTMTDATRNPRHPERAAGGSSGGSAAAVAAGLADVGLGTDTGGSVRIPAAYCDLVSLKPSHGRTDMSGIVPLAPAFDVAGVMTRDVEALLAAAPALVSGWRPHVGASPARFTYGADAMEAADPPVAEAFTQALSLLPHAEPKRDPVPLEPLAEAHSIVVCAEGYAVHAPQWRANPAGFPPVAAGALGFAETLTPRQVSDARVTAEKGRAAWQAAMAEDEILMLPTLPMAPAPRGAESAVIRGERHPITNANIRFNLAFNVAGLPVVVAPVAGLSMQFVGAHRRDEWLLATVADVLSRSA